MTIQEMIREGLIEAEITLTRYGEALQEGKRNEIGRANTILMFVCLADRSSGCHSIQLLRSQLFDRSSQYQDKL